MTSKRNTRNRYTTEQALEKLLLDNQYDIESDPYDSTDSSESMSSIDGYESENDAINRKCNPVKHNNGKKCTGKNKLYGVNFNEEKIGHKLSKCSSHRRPTCDPQYQISHEGRICDKQVQLSKCGETSGVLPKSPHKHDKPEESSTEHVFEIQLDEDETSQIASHDIEIAPVQSSPVQSEEIEIDNTLNLNEEQMDLSYSNLDPNPVIEPIPSIADENDDNSNDYYTIEQEIPVESTESDDNEENIQLPLTNFEGDKDFPDDIGWEKRDIDTGASFGPFLKSAEINIDVTDPTPEKFFEALFDEAMFQKIADETNSYARAQVHNNLQGMDPFEVIGDQHYLPHGRRNTWQDISSGDVQIFFSHLIIMGLVKKTRLDSYWSTGNLARTPFFGRYLSRNDFQRILWNLHCDDSSANPLPGTIMYFIFKSKIQTIPVIQ